MSYNFIVKSNAYDQGFLFTRNFNTPGELHEVSKLCVNRRGVGHLEALLITVRTDTLTNFSKDFLFPTLVSHALKIHNILLRILMAPVFICMDMFTLPIRIITLIPRYLYNVKFPKQDHPLYRYLINNGVALEKLSQNSVYAKVEYIEGTTVGWTKTINFIELPDFETPNSYQIGNNHYTLTSQ